MTDFQGVFRIMAGEKNSRNENNSFGFYLACFLILLILLGAAVLLFPVWQDYRSKDAELLRLRAEVEKLKAERNEKLEKTADLERSPDAVEKVAREKFKLVRPGDRVLEYKVPRKVKNQ
ncbi:MAG: septum formation initiator family protein [Lentisphaeria bacterium]|nr:septum formation initiator family protein [Lentisphaeria bacterium]